MTETEGAAGSTNPCPECGTPAARAEARFCRACGAGLPTSEESVPAVERREEPQPRRRKRRGLIVAGALLAVSILVTTGLRLAQTHLYAPEDPVEELFAAISEKDGDRAAKLLGLEDDEKQLISDEALEQGFSPPADLEITEVEHGISGNEFDEDTRRPTRDLGRVSFRYRVDDEVVESTAYVQREKTGWLRKWEIFPGRGGFIGAVYVTSPYIDSARVAAHEIENVDDPDNIMDNEGPIRALPGSYTLAIGDDEPLFEGGDLGSIAVVGANGHLTDIYADDNPVRVSIDDHLDVRPDVVEEAEDQISSHLEDCAEDTTLNPSACPMRVERDDYFTVEDVEWVITEEPEVEMGPTDPDDHSTAPVAVETTTPGAAEVSYSYANADRDPQEDSIEFEVGGYVRLDDDGAVTWAPTSQLPVD